MSHSPFYQQIVEEGRLEMGRADVLEVLKIRFGSEAATEFTDFLNAITNTNRLRELHRAGIKCRGIGGFRRAVRME